MGWGSSMRRGGGRKARALPRKFVFLGFRRELGCPGNFAGMSRTSKSLCKKTFSRVFSFPKYAGVSSKRAFFFAVKGAHKEGMRGGVWGGGFGLGLS